MKVISVNVGQPQTVNWKGREVTTSIFKSPVNEPVQVEELGLTSDSQSDLKVHGGRYKAVYAYPSEHYIYWESMLPDFEFQWGAFGENLTISGLSEDDVQIGDHYKIGSTELKVIQPRFPCMKLGMRFGDPAMVKKFLESRRSGFYFQVMKNGTIATGDSIEIVNKTNGTSIKRFVDLYAEPTPPMNEVELILNDHHLIDEWKEYFENKLTQVT